MLPSNAGDGGAEATWPWRGVEAESCWQQCCRVCLAMALSSPLGDGAAESC
jgi:hypothetical protein